MHNNLRIDEIDVLIDHHENLLLGVMKSIIDLESTAHMERVCINSLRDARSKILAQQKLQKNITENLKYAYSHTWTLVKKTEFILRTIRKKISTTRQIAELIKEKEERFNSHVDSKIIGITRSMEGSVFVDADGSSYSPQVFEEYTTVSTSESAPILTTIDIPDLVNKLGATLKQKVDKADIFNRIEIDGVIYYGLIDWFEGDGVKKEFLI